MILMFGRWINKTVLFRICDGVFVGIYLIPLISTETGMFAYNRNLLIRIVLISVFAVLFTRLRNRKVGFVFQIILFLTVAINAVINHGKEFAKPVQEDGKWRPRLERVVGDAHCVKSNNVYLLVYDAYGHRSILDGLRLQDDEIYGKLKEKGYSLIPLKLYFRRGFVKMELALCTGKKNYDKRRDMAEKDAKREMQRVLKERNKF